MNRRWSSRSVGPSAGQPRTASSGSLTGGTRDGRHYRLSTTDDGGRRDGRRDDRGRAHVNGGSPGFGPVVALVPFVAAALVTLRRR
ncbi:PGF-CTERM sorting domain-containing protein [Haloarchaeobius sp. FL176]|uniref:PGF-CTERM sorting domain-containing protein n=1 Tax=Haloarchaeobius sp. FL176 TaxID=2967129 RepID=UPI0034E94292